MVQLDVNGSRQTIYPGSMEELQSYLLGLVPPDEVVCSLHVNGEDVSEAQLTGFDVGGVRTIELRSAQPGDLARGAVGETITWIGGICTALEGVSRFYREGQEREAANQLIPVVDALHVLVELLGAIDRFLPPEAAVANEGRKRWEAAENTLKTAIESLMAELESGDPVRIADAAGYAVPQALVGFREVLQGVAA